MLPNLAIYTTSCSLVYNTTFCKCTYTMYPHYYVSNNEELLNRAEQLGWIPLKLPAEVGVPVDHMTISTMQGKYAKVLPHKFPQLTQYEFLVFVDDKYKLKEEKLVLECTLLRQHQSVMALRPHWLEAHVLFEFAEAMLQPRYFAERGQYITYIMAQQAAGLKLQLPTKHYQCNCLLRDMKHPEMQSLNETWYAHIKQCGIEDQISFFFISQLFKTSLLPWDIF